MKKSTTRKILYGLFIVLCIELVLQGIVSFNHNPELTYFAFAGLIAVITLAVTLGVEKISNDKLESELKCISETLKRIEDKLCEKDAKQSSHEPTVDKEKK